MSVSSNALVSKLSPEIVYHYCSQNVFESIIENGLIWAADLRSMNDPREVGGSVQMAESFLDSLNFPENSISNDLIKILAPRFRSFNGMSRFFCSSFTYLDDDLYSWLNYGSRGSGFAIGLRKKFFSTYYWRDVTYSEVVFRNQLSSIWSDAIREVAEGKTVDEASVSAAIALQRACVSNKHASWSNEREARLVLPLLMNRDSTFDLSLVDDVLREQKVAFRGSSLGIRPYVELDLRKLHEISIIEVMIGPNNQTSEEVLSAFLRSCGFNGVNVVSSKCKFR